MVDQAERDRLKALEAKIAAAKKAQEPAPRIDEHYSGAQMAWRMVIELVAGLIIGFGIGFGLDALLGTQPLFLVLFILLGFVAGVKSMLRTAREAQDDAAKMAARHEGD